MSGAQEIALTLGGHRSGKGWVCRCPAHQDKAPSLSLRDGEIALLVHCFAGCSNAAVLDALRGRGLLLSPSKNFRRSPAPRPASVSSHLPAWLDESQERTKAALQIWDATVPLKNTLGQRYFVEGRSLHVGLLDLDHYLRWHSGISAVVGLMTHPTTNESTGIHRTFIAEDATKIERKMLGKIGVIRLTADEHVLEGLAIAEGIEDALAVLLSGWGPVWAATSAGAIAKFPVLIGIESITIIADADKPGQAAAQACAARWREAGAEAFISTPGDQT